MTKEKGSKMTIDKLAEIMAKSFAHFQGEMKEEFASIRTDINRRFDKVEIILDRIEHTLDINHENRIARIEDDLRIIKTKLEK